MYKEIHPLDLKSVIAEERNIKKLEPFLLKLESIEKIIPVIPVTTNTEIKFCEIRFMQGDRAIITKEEADEIKSLLLKSRKDPLAEELSHLTSAIRELHHLLGARL